MADASVIAGSFHAIRVHHTLVVAAKIVIVNRGVVCIHRVSLGQLLLIGWILCTLSPCVSCQFVWEGVDGARYLVVDPRLLVACFFGLIDATVLFPVASTGALDVRVLC